MKVKKYVGETIQDTIFKVKADLGSDAIILNTRKYKKGGFLGLFAQKRVEVLAAIEENDKIDNSRTLNEIDNLKKMVSSLSRNWQTDAYSQNLPDKLTKLYNHFKDEGINEEVIKELIDGLQKDQVEQDLLLQEVKNWIIDLIGQPSPIDVQSESKRVAFIGPTGVGKTTTIAKLAAKFALEDDKKVALITTDTYRIAAVQQLQTYSDIVNVPLVVVYNQEELRKMLTEKFRDYDLVLIDTAGSSWNDKMHLGRLKKFVQDDLINEIHLLLCLNTKSKDLDSIIDHFSSLNPDKLIFSKLDETSTYGDLVNIKNNYDYPYSYISIGQDVPDDIRVAHPEIIMDYLLGDDFNV